MIQIKNKPLGNWKSTEKLKCDTIVTFMLLDAFSTTVLSTVPVMNTNFFFVTVLGVMLGTLGLMGADPCASPTPDPGPTPPDNNPPDPAFMNSDPRPRSAKPKKTSSRDVKDAGISAADQQAWQEIYAKMEKNPAQSFQAVGEVWRQNRPKEFQKLAIVKARTLVKSTDEASDLDFMLACLENPEAQREACLKMGKGNGLERDMASRRLAILEANPHLQLKLNN